MSLKDDGFKYVYQEGKFLWRHPNLINNDAIDCTDISDFELKSLIKKIINKKGEWYEGKSMDESDR